MNLLYIVNFHAPMGGLHENVYASALYMKEQGCAVYVVLKPGRLQQRMEAKGIHTITTDFSDADETLRSIENVDVAFDLVHFHPGPSKYPALNYAEKYNVPLIETYHGIWLDDLEEHIDQLDAIITVSEGIKNHLQSRIDTHHEKYYVMPNGYDSSLFDQPKYYDEESGEINIGFVTRLDKDKQFIMDILLLAVNHIKTKSDDRINIHIIGDGTHRDEFLELCQDMLKDTEHTIQFKGWLVDEELKNAYLDCDIIIAPGRSAIEGMACGKPVIAVGSKIYIGLITQQNWQSAVYSNFGGAGKKFADYEVASIENDLDYLLDEKNNINRLGSFGNEVARQFFDSDKINQGMYNLYRILVSSKNL
ncbi:MAG TPA: glycosyltransferase family 4 protein [Virgibacillus sp.]|nr:glycosyltransferase family 4 protein [Virgibacillus sp.]HLR66797.1 glycosyltransferase family 4 protein [Virgibacillus sp.]